MPHIDKRSGDVVIRVVYDGAPEAGKTTNIQALVAAISLQRRGTHASPGTTGRRTEFFDWLDFSGGFVDGRRVRCQLVSVPGQPQLLHRRRYLLESADAIVFVADSRPAHLETSRADLATLRQILERLDQRTPVGIVLQANKQDLEGALSPSELSAALEAPPEVYAVGTIAASGRGVMDTFVLATRLATDRVRALVLEGELAALDERDVSPSTLHEAMLAIEVPAVAPPLEVVPAPPKATHPACVPRRRNDVESARAHRLPRPETLLAGHVWPSVRGRAVIAAALKEPERDLDVPAYARDWAPPSPIEMVCADKWILHSSAEWRFDDESAARIALITTARACVALPELVPDGRAFFVCPDEEGFRLWMLSPGLASLADEVLAGLMALDSEALTTALERARRASSRLRELGHPGVVPEGAAGIAIHDERVVLLGLETCRERSDAVSPEEHALKLATSCAGADEDRLACLAVALESFCRRG